MFVGWARGGGGWRRMKLVGSRVGAGYLPSNQTNTGNETMQNQSK